MSRNAENQRFAEILKKNKSVRKNSGSGSKKKKKDNGNNSFLLRQSCAILQKNKQITKSLATAQSLIGKYENALKDKEESEMALMIKLNGKIISVRKLQEELSSCQEKLRRYEDFIRDLAATATNVIKDPVEEEAEEPSPVKRKLPQRVRLTKRQSVKKPWISNLSLVEESSSPVAGVNRKTANSRQTDQQLDVDQSNVAQQIIPKINVIQEVDQQTDMNQSVDQQIDVDQQNDMNQSVNQQTDMNQSVDQQIDDDQQIDMNQSVDQQIDVDQQTAVNQPVERDDPFLDETPFDPDAFELHFADESVLSNDVTMPSQFTVVTMPPVGATVVATSNKATRTSKRRSRKSSSHPLLASDISRDLIGSPERLSTNKKARTSCVDESVIVTEQRTTRRRTRQSVAVEKCDVIMVESEKKRAREDSGAEVVTATRPKRKSSVKSYLKRTGLDVYNCSNEDSFKFDPDTKVTIACKVTTPPKVTKEICLTTKGKRAMSDISNESSLKSNSSEFKIPQRKSVSHPSSENEPEERRRGRRRQPISYKEQSLITKKRREWTEKEMKKKKKGNA